MNACWKASLTAWCQGCHHLADENPRPSKLPEPLARKQAQASSMWQGRYMGKLLERGIREADIVIPSWMGSSMCSSPYFMLISTFFKALQHHLQFRASHPSTCSMPSHVLPCVVVIGWAQYVIPAIILFKINSTQILAPHPSSTCCCQFSSWVPITILGLLPEEYVGKQHGLYTRSIALGRRQGF